MATAATVPSAGTEVTAAAATPAPSVDYSQTTDDQILEQPESGAAEGETSPGAGAAEQAETATGGQAKPGEQKPGEAAKETKEEPETPISESEALKSAFKLPGVGSELRTAWYAEKAYREVFPTVAEAREVRALFPTTEEAKGAVVARDELAKFDDLYFGNTPESHGNFLRSLREEDPDVFRSFAANFGRVHFEVDPEGYRTDTAARIENTLANLRRAAETEEDENAVNAVDVLAARLFGRKSGQPAKGDPREAELTRREQAISQRETEAQAGQFRGFYDASNEATVTKVLGDIEALLKTALPAETSDAVKRRMTREIYNALDEKLRANRDLRQQLRRGFNAAQTAKDYGEERKAGLVQLVHSRAKQLLPAIAKTVVNEWTQQVLRTNQERLQKQRTAASRVDIGSGGAPAGKSGLPSPAEINYRKMSDDDILNLAD